MCLRCEHVNTSDLEKNKLHELRGVKFFKDLTPNLSNFLPNWDS